MRDMIDARMTPPTAPEFTERMALLGEIVWLLSHSDLHRESQLDEVESLFVHPESVGQMRRWYRSGQLVALATWAWLSPEVEAVYLDDGQIPRGAWQSGDRLWFVDVIAPFGDARAVTTDLRGLIRPGTEARSARWTEGGTLRKIGRFRR